MNSVPFDVPYGVRDISATSLAVTMNKRPTIDRNSAFGPDMSSREMKAHKLLLPRFLSMRWRAYCPTVSPRHSAYNEKRLQAAPKTKATLSSMVLNVCIQSCAYLIASLLILNCPADLTRWAWPNVRRSREVVLWIFDGIAHDLFRLPLGSLLDMAPTASVRSNY